MESKMCLNDLRSYSRLWLTEFMEIYRNEECLWQGKHTDYSNHAIRNASYDKLVEKLKEVEPHPDRAMVVRKINSLRSAFRREYRKKLTKDNYESRLWYFDKLMFIADQNPKRLFGVQKRELKINFDDDSIDYEQEEESDKNETIQSEEHITSVPEPIRCHVIKSENNNSNNSQHRHRQEQSIPQQSSLKVLDITSLDVNSQREIQQAVDSLEQQHQQQMHNAHQGQQTQVTQIHHQQVPTIQISREHLPTLFNSTTFEHPRPNDEFDAVGTNIASKLRVMNHTQRIIAEKVIKQQHQQQMHNAHQGQQTQVTQIHHQQVPTIQISREHLPTLFNSTTFEHPRPNDEFDAVGTNIASKLRVMNHTQRIIAEKVISDILFNGQLGNLNISSTLVN